MEKKAHLQMKAKWQKNCILQYNSNELRRARKIKGTEEKVNVQE